jgi:mannitol-1-phosphate/altronate dehydrogenase
VVERLADPATRIITLTVTEGGYQLPEELRPTSGPVRALPR